MNEYRLMYDSFTLINSIASSRVSWGGLGILIIVIANNYTLISTYRINYQQVFKSRGRKPLRINFWKAPFFTNLSFPPAPVHKVMGEDRKRVTNSVAGPKNKKQNGIRRGREINIIIFCTLLQVKKWMPYYLLTRRGINLMS